jgi:RNA polymerase sigma-70 factor (ECF subfamily)
MADSTPHTDSEKKNETKREASSSSLEDLKWINQANKGNELAFKKLMDKYERGLHFHISKMLRDKTLLEDLIQEIFIKTYRNLKNYNPDYAFSTWLYRIATNHTIDYLRKKKLQTYSIDDPIQTKDGEMQMELKDSDASADAPIEQAQRKVMVQEAIQQLPEKYRMVIEMRHMQELSYQEIADELDLPIGTVKAHIFRAREALYKLMKDRIHHYY